jgi:hypothetical protein
MFTDENAITLHSGYYTIAIEYPGTTSGNYLLVATDVFDHTHDGNDSYYAGEWAVAALGDLIFYLFEHFRLNITQNNP